ncbi:hypothetical protein SDC9_108242 [bioreactor metagenome]|uniref:Uncharacterized protein n=1 Tax=bioreactor metagenome TaxID=1076179 RepID=A0A645BI16_9ZZZZ
MAALIKGSLPIVEVVLRNDEDFDTLCKIHENYPHVLLGAGQVLNTKQVDKAIQAGAQFIVTNGFNTDTIGYCVDHQILIIPGCSTVTELENALAYGLTTVNLFSVDHSLEFDHVSKLTKMYDDMSFIINNVSDPSDITEFLNNNQVLACGTTQIIDKTLMDANDFEGISQLIKKAILTTLGLTLKHVAVNASSATSKDLAEHFAEIFGGVPRQTSKGYFGSEFVEIMNNGIGEHGHIAVGCNDVRRARRYFESLGYSFDESTIMNKNNKLNFIYFQEEFGGFKVHLINN